MINSCINSKEKYINTLPYLFCLALLTVFILNKFFFFFFFFFFFNFISFSPFLSLNEQQRATESSWPCLASVLFPVVRSRVSRLMRVKMLKAFAIQRCRHRCPL